MAAQIAQWQSAYQPRDPNDPETAPNAAAATTNNKPDLPAVNPNSDKKQTVVRQGGGKKWSDDSLLEWDPAHLRLFVGNLGGETNDDALLKAFSRWETVQKARVVRDKRTNKSKGYGFVSFSGADDFFDAAKTMNKAYIQNRPVVVRKANTEIKVTNVKEKNNGRNRGNNRNNNKSGGGGGAGGYEPSLGPKQSGGVTKPGQKTKNGLRLLG
jgi:RNA recognition motif-containing protein